MQSRCEFNKWFSRATFSLVRLYVHRKKDRSLSEMNKKCNNKKKQWQRTNYKWMCTKWRCECCARRDYHLLRFSGRYSCAKANDDTISVEPFTVVHNCNIHTHTSQLRVRIFSAVGYFVCVVCSVLWHFRSHNGAKVSFNIHIHTFVYRISECELAWSMQVRSKLSRIHNNNDARFK